jgi:hypothetical protein
VNRALEFIRGGRSVPAAFAVSTRFPFGPGTFRLRNGQNVDTPWPRVAAWLAIVATAILILSAAKAHGRQIRLEREARGFMRVDFRSRNEPYVEALWRRDRRLFWATFAFLAGFSLVAAAVTADWPLGGFLMAWSFAASFVAAGLASWRRFFADAIGEAVWRRQAVAGSVRWWLLVLLAAATAGIAWRWPTV